MRLSVSKSKNSTSLYVIKSTYENGVHSSKIVEKLGTVEQLKERLNGQDPIEWAKSYIDELNKKEREGKQDIIVKYSPSKLIEKGEQRSFNGGYLFLRQIYYGLQLDKLCGEISRKYKFTFDMNSVLSRLIYARILYPSSKLATQRLAERFIEQPGFELQHIYRALEILSKESDSIQSFLYDSSLKFSKRNTGILYYDCTNYFFEIEQEEGLKQYGVSKEHRPNPIVQMGLFMDGDGIPLAFNISKGNTNEQQTLKPLEQKILSDFNLSKFIVCTDAGLASIENRKFNDKGERAFITTQSIKKLKVHLREWAIDPKGWQLGEDKKRYDISELDETEHKENVFHKECWINENGLEQRIIVTYSIKYRDYQRAIRNSQIDRARKLIETNTGKVGKSNPNDFKRFIEKIAYTPDGEVAQHNLYTIDTKLVSQEEAFDGFYAVCTNLEDGASAIIRVNKRRWEIEECFRIMKSEFKARPVYLSRDDRIQAHFMTCFISLVIYRLLEKMLHEKYTCHEIIYGLKEMNFLEIKGDGYIPCYTRTDFTDDLHDVFGFRTDYQIVKKSLVKKILKLKKPE